MAKQGSCDCCSPSAAETAVPSDDEAVCYCPVNGVIETISKKYALQIISLLGAHGPMRYGGLEDRLEVTSSSLLSARLDELTEEGLIERRSFDEIPPRVEYSLTPRGRELEMRIQPLLEWAADEE
ncbi:winged helix-turn-helix transcriptional regulator [Natrinema salifodinae]|uniref:Transcriptional regulator, HxlR family n=1 Tax=Natrinema salifodinae TaxID=1202768 RepID=A0A1I0P4I8_9EURY|nr:helix-turn-helix domain-containing protein [Natrinema salifodinae]SEW08967.1 transcriptional regulator, HxlR family [Natrinema salifodinae]